MAQRWKKAGDGGGADKNGKFPPLESSAGRIIVDISVAGVAGFLLLSVCIYIGFFRKNQLKGELAPEICFGQADHGSPWDTASGSTGGASPVLTEISVDKSVVFSYKELSKATDTFSLANKIGEGGFGSVYYAELRGEKAAIKKMNIQASKEFLTELKVLTHVHHLNLVYKKGLCVEQIGIDKLNDLGVLIQEEQVNFNNVTIKLQYAAARRARKT